MAWWQYCPETSRNEDDNMCETNNFYLWLLQVIGLLGLLALCLWLSLRPKSPKYTIIDLSVPSINNSATDDGILSYNLEIQNPNKDSYVYYDDILLTFYNGQDRVATSTISSFHRQGKDKTNQFIDHANISADKWKSLHNVLLNATTELRVGLVTRIQYKTWGLKSKHHGVDLEGKIPIGKDGKIPNNKKKKFKLTRPSKKRILKATRFV